MSRRVGAFGRIELALARVANRRGLYLGRRSTRLHCAIYRRSGGRLGGRMPGFPEVRIVLLDHTGARSGIRRTSPLMALEESEGLIVAASKAGQPTHPSWFHNVLAHPETTVQLGPEVRRVRARVATDPEHRRLWPRLVAMYPGFEDFARAAAPRKIPLVVLEPRR